MDIKIYSYNQVCYCFKPQIQIGALAYMLVMNAAIKLEANPMSDVGVFCWGLIEI